MVLYKRVAAVLTVLVAALVFAVPAFAQSSPSSAGTAKSALAWPTYSYGSSGNDVATAQYLLLYHGAYRGSPNLQPTGYFGTQTRAAVQFTQSARGIRPVNGVLNAPTWRALTNTVRYGQRNDAVKALQVELRYQYGYNYLPVTGYYGNLTSAAVRNFKLNYGRGYANVDTNGYLVGGPAWHAIISYR